MPKEKPYTLRSFGNQREVVFRDKEVCHNFRGLRVDQIEEIVDGLNKAYNRGLKDAKEEK